MGLNLYSEIVRTTVFCFLNQICGLSLNSVLQRYMKSKQHSITFQKLLFNLARERKPHFSKKQNRTQFLQKRQL